MERTHLREEHDQEHLWVWGMGGMRGRERGGGWSMAVQTKLTCLSSFGCIARLLAPLLSPISKPAFLCTIAVVSSSIEVSPNEDESCDAEVTNEGVVGSRGLLLAVTGGVSLVGVDAVGVLRRGG